VPASFHQHSGSSPIRSSEILTGPVLSIGRMSCIPEGTIWVIAWTLWRLRTAAQKLCEEWRITARGTVGDDIRESP
jgi:hypothetical protein